MKFIDFNKKMIKPFLIIISFLMVLALILQVLSVTVFSTGAAATYANKFANAYSFLTEPDNTIDVVVVGDSNMYSAIVPSKLWESKGYTSTLIGAPRQTVNNSIKYLKRVYETQKPQLVVIETDMFYRGVPDRYNTEFDFESEKTLDTFFDIADPENGTDLVSGLFPVFSFHDRWKTMISGKNKNVSDPNSHGYHLSVAVRPFDPADYMKPSDNKEPIKKNDLDNIERFMSICKENGSEVLWICVPCPKSWCMERHNTVAALAEEYGVSFIDYNLMWEEIGLDSQLDYRDKGTHLNFGGAKKLTKDFGAYLESAYNLTDHRGDSTYSFWDESAQRFNKDVKKLCKKENRKKK